MRGRAGIGYDRRVVEVARSLGLSGRGDSLGLLRQHALGRIDRIVEEWPEPIGSVDDLLAVAAARLSVCIEYIRADSDVRRISLARAAYSSQLEKILHAEFVRGTSEGLLLEHERPERGDRRFLVIVDARGARAPRAFFTVWHEISHVLTTPPQLEMKLYRRTPAAEEKRKDPVESAIDHVAGALAFYAPIFAPALDRAIERQANITFRAIDEACAGVAPGASTYAATIAAVRLRDEPLCFVHAQVRLKPSEISRRNSIQGDLGLDSRPPPAPKLRLVDVIPNEAARHAGVRLHEHLRVPPSSIMAAIEREQLDGEFAAAEDQSMWETSAAGALAPLAYNVSATRRASSIYGLLAM